MPPTPETASKRRAIIIASVAVLGVLIVIVWLVVRPFRQAPETVAVTRQDLTEAVEVSGVVASARLVNLKAETTGPVAERLAPEGRRVAAAAPLLRIDPTQARLQLAQAETNARASLRQAEAALASARKTLGETTDRQRVSLMNMENQLAKATSAVVYLERELARNRSLLAEGAVTRVSVEQQEQQLNQARLDVAIARDNLNRVRTASELVAARNAVTQAETALSSAREQGASAVALAREALAKTLLLAPFAGTVTAWSADVGDMLAPGTPVAVFQDLEDLRLRLPVDELDLPKMRLGGPVSITFDAFAESPYAGSIAQISRASVESTANVQVFPVEVTFDNPDLAIRPGMSGDARVIVQTLQGVLAVPLTAVSREGGKYWVSRWRDGEVERVAIVPGLVTLESVEVKSGLEEGDRILATAAPAP